MRFLSLAAGSLFVGFVILLGELALLSGHRPTIVLTSQSNWFALIVAAIVLPAVLATTAIFSGLSSEWIRGRQSNETNCRRCGYILRGLTKPRCPECSEPI